MTDLPSRLRHAIDAVEAVTADEVIVAHRARRRRTKRAAGLVAVVAVIAAGIGVTAVTGGGPARATRVQVGPASVVPLPVLSQAPLTSTATAHGVTTTLTIDTARTVPGTPIGGRLLVVNRTGKPLAAGETCPNSAFEVFLAAGHRSSSVGVLTPGCVPAFAFPVGSSSYALSVSTLDTSAGSALPPLPDGAYRTVLQFGVGFDLPIPRL